MEPEAAKFIGAGLATLGMIGAGLGVGQVWSNYFNALARNPAAKDEIGANIWIGLCGSPKRLRSSRWWSRC